MHLGIVVIATGMIGSGLFQQALTVHMTPGAATRIHDVTLTLRGIEDIEGGNWTGRRAIFSVSRGGDVVAMMTPANRFYTVRGMSTTETAIRSELAGDLYIFVGDATEDGIVAQIYWNPLIGWVWAGWMVVLAGAILSLSERVARRRPAPSPLSEAEGVPAE